MLNLAEKISEHFTLGEAVKSQSAVRLGIDNEPGDGKIIDSIRLVSENILEKVRAHYNILFSPNSWYRCLELNRAIGSKDNSQHILGQAVDLELPGIDNREAFDWIRNNLDFDQLILEFYRADVSSSGWVHVSCVSRVSSGKNRHQALIFDGVNYELVS